MEGPTKANWILEKANGARWAFPVSLLAFGIACALYYCSGSQSADTVAPSVMEQAESSFTQADLPTLGGIERWLLAAAFAWLLGAWHLSHAARQPLGQSGSALVDLQLFPGEAPVPYASASLAADANGDSPDFVHSRGEG